MTSFIYGMFKTNPEKPNTNKKDPCTPIFTAALFTTAKTWTKCIGSKTMA